MLDNIVSVDFKGDVTDSLMLSNDTLGWGFAIHNEVRSAFIAIGDKREMDRDIIRRDYSLPMLVLDAVRCSFDEIANDFIELAFLEETGILINGRHFSHKELVAARCSIGEG